MGATYSDAHRLFLALHSGSVLAVLGGPNGMPRIELGLTACKENTLCAVVALWSELDNFINPFRMAAKNLSSI